MNAITGFCAWLWAKITFAAPLINWSDLIAKAEHAVEVVSDPNTTIAERVTAIRDLVRALFPILPVSHTPAQLMRATARQTGAVGVEAPDNLIGILIAIKNRVQELGGGPMNFDGTLIILFLRLVQMLWMVAAPLMA